LRSLQQKHADSQILSRKNGKGERKSRKIAAFSDQPTLFLPTGRATFALAVAAEHLRRDEKGLQERACREAARE
jgi:hypothetical protein